jgi:hypothetical protein
MSRRLTLFATATDTATEETLEALHTLPGYHVEVVRCPRSSSDWFTFPFLRDEEGVPYYGPSGINFFIARARANRR